VRSDESTRDIAWGAWMLAALGTALLLLGTMRYVQRHRFGLLDVFHCCAALAVAAFGLIVISYVIQHARLVAVIPLFGAGVLLFSSPAFDVAFGLALIGAMVGPALSGWKEKKFNFTQRRERM
jgi:hypothetical protein